MEAEAGPEREGKPSSMASAGVQRGPPLEKSPSEPNARTRHALSEAEERRNLVSHGTAAELFADLGI